MYRIKGSDMDDIKNGCFLQSAQSISSNHNYTFQFLVFSKYRGIRYLQCTLGSYGYGTGGSRMPREDTMEEGKQTIFLIYNGVTFFT